MIDLDELRENAQAATKGPWRWTKVDYGGHNFLSSYEEYNDAPFDALWSDGKRSVVFVAQDASSYAASCDFPNDADARFIAAVNPSVVIELIDRVEKAEALAPPLDDYDEMHALEDENERLRALLARAVEALKPFHLLAPFEARGWADEHGWTDRAPKNERICDWFGPTDFRDVVTVAREIKEALR